MNNKINQIKDMLIKFAEYRTDVICIDLQGSPIEAAYTEDYWIDCYLSEYNLACKMSDIDSESICGEEYLELFQFWFNTIIENLNALCKENKYMIDSDENNTIYITKP